MTVKRIIVVDDDRHLRETLSDLLTLEGYQVEMAGTGEDALSLTEKEEFDVSVLDIQLPGISGIDVLRKIKETHPDMEVIILTGRATLETAIEAVNAGAFFFIQKPLDPEFLKLTIRRAIEAREARLQKEELLKFNTSIIESMNEGLIIERPDSTITYSNPAMWGLLDQPGTDALNGKKWYDFLVDIERMRLEEDIKNRQSSVQLFETALITPSGKRRDVLVSSRPFDDTENFITTFTDITELHIALRKKEEYLKKMETLFSLGFNREKEILKLKNAVAKLLSDKKVLEEEIENLKKKVYEANY